MFCEANARVGLGLQWLMVCFVADIGSFSVSFFFPQRTVITLSKENKDLNDRNEQLRSQLMEIGQKVGV